jgi:hypothetical protein
MEGKSIYLILRIIGTINEGAALMKLIVRNMTLNFPLKYRGS